MAQNTVGSHTRIDCLTQTALTQIRNSVLGLPNEFKDRGGLGSDVRYLSDYALYQIRGLFGEGGGGASQLMFNVTYAELRELRDTKSLEAGALYRITDYSTEVNEQFYLYGDTVLCQSAHHNFDIIVLALSNDTLSEDARAIKHDGGSTNDNGGDDNGGGTDNGGDDNGGGGEKVSTKSRNFLLGTKASDSDDTEEAEETDYFANSNLSAWELKYSIDVNTTFYPWAKPSGGGETKVVTLTISEQPSVVVSVTVLSENDDTYDGLPIKCETQGTYVYLPSLQIADNVVGLIQTGGESQEMEFNILEVATITNEGKGVITMMKDEFGNKLPYDFKNIKWARYLVTDAESPFYDMYYDIEGDGEPNYFYTFDGFYQEDVSCDTSLYLNVEEGSAMFNVFGEFCINNVFFGNYCYSNTFGNYCYSNTFGNDCNSNTFGNDCDSNTFGNDCNSNTFGNNCYSNTFGNNCYSNTFGNYCYSNTFGNNCYSNTFGNENPYNTFGNYCYSNTFGNENPYNKYEDGLKEIDKSDEVRVDQNTRRWYYDSNADLQSEVMCYRPLN